MITAVFGRPVIRLATFDDMQAITAMRKMQERDAVGCAVDVPVPPTWMVADCEGTVRACLGFAISDERTMIATDIYDDGTRQGKRALSALLDDAFAARAHGVRIFVWVPLDRPRLANHLERRGMRVTGYSME